MKRQVIPNEQLHKILNMKLHEHDPCGECRFTQAPVGLRTPDESGCNWSQELILRYGRRCDDSCSQVASRVITEVAEHFNLASEKPKQLLKGRRPSRCFSKMQARMLSRETHLHFQIDTNRINSRGSLLNMNRLEQWRRDGVIGLVMSDVANKEARAGRNSRRSRKAVGYIYALGFEHEASTQAAQGKIAGILFPGRCLSDNDVNDVRIAYNAWKYQHILITADRAILRKRDELAEFGLTVVTDAEAVQLVEERICKRDAEARDDTDETGDPLPWWVGRD